MCNLCDRFKDDFVDARDLRCLFSGEALIRKPYTCRPSLPARNAFFPEDIPEMAKKLRLLC
jgi:hypothetical protein